MGKLIEKNFWYLFSGITIGILLVGGITMYFCLKRIQPKPITIKANNITLGGLKYELSKVSLMGYPDTTRIVGVSEIIMNLETNKLEIK